MATNRYSTPLVGAEPVAGVAGRDITRRQEITLKVAGRNYSGWQSARVTRGIEQVAGSFELGVSERWETRGQPWPIGEGDPCVLSIGDQQLITGYVDKRSLSYSAAQHDTKVTGRDKTGDLVDCSAYLLSGSKPNWEFKSVSLQAFAEKVCAPFGVRVSMQAGLAANLPPALPKIVVSPGESAFTALENLCRTFGVLPVSDGNGGLLLTRAGTARCATSLVEGENILAASAEFDYSGRFRKYLVLAQHRGTDESFGETVATVSGSAEDPEVTRDARVLVIRPENAQTSAQAKVRAQWEAKVRAARSASIDVTVAGWTQSSGTLWPINSIVRVKSTLLGVDGDMLITQASFTLSLAGGTTTALQLRRPDAFVPEPVVRSDAGRWKEIRSGATTYNTVKK